jgi:hypothetical protein
VAVAVLQAEALAPTTRCSLWLQWPNARLRALQTLAARAMRSTRPHSSPPYNARFTRAQTTLTTRLLSTGARATQGSSAPPQATHPLSTQRCAQPLLVKRGSPRRHLPTRQRPWLPHAPRSSPDSLRHQSPLVPQRLLGPCQQIMSLPSRKGLDLKDSSITLAVLT